MIHYSVLFVKPFLKKVRLSTRNEARCLLRLSQSLVCSEGDALPGVLQGQADEPEEVEAALADLPCSSISGHSATAKQALSPRGQGAWRWGGRCSSAILSPSQCPQLSVQRRGGLPQV